MSEEKKMFVVKQYSENAIEPMHCLNEYANQLWDTFESEFLENCIESTKDTIYNQPLPFE